MSDTPYTRLNDANRQIAGHLRELTHLRAREAVLVKAAQNAVNNFGHYERRGLGSYSPMVGTIDTDKIAELADALATLDVPDPKEG